MMRPLVGVAVAIAMTIAACDAGADQPVVSDVVPRVEVLDRNGVVLGEISVNETIAEPWAEAVRSELIRLAGADFRAGEVVSILTTIDAEDQRALERSLSLVPSTQGRFEAVAVAIEVSNGSIRAIGDTAGSALAAVPRPTGSMLKFVIAAAAVRQGALGGDVIDGSTACTIPTENGPLSFAGDETVGTSPLYRQAARSVNCAFAKLYEIVGADEVLALAAELGLSEVRLDTPTIAVGTASVTPLEAAAAFRVIVGDGVFQRPFVITAFTTLDGVMHSVSPVASRRVLTSEQSARTAALLTHVVTDGTAQQAQPADGRSVAAKTGTQENNTDAWIVGGTPDISVAVWLGNPAAPSDSMIDVAEFGAVTRVRGGTYPALILRDFIESTGTRRPARSFRLVSEARPAVQLVLPSIECFEVESTMIGTMTAVEVESEVRTC